jgi:hypothetical protein
MEDESTRGNELEGVQKLVQPENEATSDEAKRLKGRELDDALYAALLSRAHSDQARALVDTVAKLIIQQEIAAGTRTNKRDKKQTALASAVERFLADLLQAQASETNKGYVFRPLRPEGFTGHPWRVHGCYRDAWNVVQSASTKATGSVRKICLLSAICGRPVRVPPSAPIFDLRRARRGIYDQTCISGCLDARPALPRRH